MGFLVTRPEFEQLRKHVAEIVEQLNANTIAVQAITGMDVAGNPIDELTQRIDRLEGLAVLRDQLDQEIANLTERLKALRDFVEATSTHIPPA